MALVFVLSIAFGFLLSRSGAADFDVIQHMFLFDAFHMYGVLAVGVGLTMPGLWLLGATAARSPASRSSSLPSRFMVAASPVACCSALAGR